jgi:hypothetical protein
VDLLTALTALAGMVSAAMSVPEGIRGFAALILKAQQEGRDISPEEISLLKGDDDELAAQLDATIAAAGRGPK